MVIDGRGNGLQFYSGGIYNTTECSTITLNHAMLLVGYGTDTSSGRDYWILKNRQDTVLEKKDTLTLFMKEPCLNSCMCYISLQLGYIVGH